jgi:methionyl-tRNA formyltransferase
MPLISELLRLASRGVAIPRIEQDLSQREYYSRQIPGDGYIDWNRPAREIVNLVRAFDHRPFPCPWGYLKTQALGAPTAILKAADTGLAANVPPGTIDNSSSQDRICIASFDNWVHIREHLALAPE